MRIIQEQCDFCGATQTWTSVSVSLELVVRLHNIAGHDACRDCFERAASLLYQQPDIVERFEVLDYPKP